METTRYPATSMSRTRYRTIENRTEEKSFSTQFPKLLLTVTEAAGQLGIGRTQMYTLISSGAVKSVLIGKLRRIRPADLEAYTASLVTAPIDRPAA